MTNLVEFGARTSVEYEARKWLIRMDGDEPLTAAEQDSLREWMGLSPVHRSELLRLAEFWDGANILTQLHREPFAADRQISKKTALSGFVPRILVALSAILASVVVTYTGIRNPGGTVTQAYETPIGHQKTVVLADGSAIQLNTNSRLEIIYSKESRTVRLTRGEVHLSATYDSRRIFQVQVANSLVRALGTAFDVRLEGRTVEVIVTKGLVEVVDGTNVTTAPAVRLKAGEATSFSSGSGTMPVRQLTDIELQQRLSWREGYLAFSGEPLSEVVETFNRYSTVKLEIGDRKLASISVGGSFQLGDVSAAVDLLTLTCGIRAERVNATTIRLDSRTEP